LTERSWKRPTQLDDGFNPSSAKWIESAYQITRGCRNISFKLALQRPSLKKKMRVDLKEVRMKKVNVIEGEGACLVPQVKVSLSRMNSTVGLRV
jgi:hypothetical protein